MQKTVLFRREQFFPQLFEAAERLGDFRMRNRSIRKNFEVRGNFSEFRVVPFQFILQSDKRIFILRFRRLEEFLPDRLLPLRKLIAPCFQLFFLGLLVTPEAVERFRQQRRRTEDRGKLLQYCLFDIGNRHIAQWTTPLRAFRILQALQINIATFILLSIGCGHRPAAVAAAHQSLQWILHLVPLLAQGRGIGLEQYPGLLPQLLIDDRLMFAGVNLVLVRHLSDIKNIVQQPVDVRGVEFPAPMDFSFASGPGFVAMAEFVQFQCELFCRAEFAVALEFSPLAQGDFSKWNITTCGGDFRSEEIIYKYLRPLFPEAWGDRAPEGRYVSAGFYNTAFMWPMMVFGYENFMLLCLEPEFERIMAEFSELSRRAFRALARLPISVVISHDDIVLPTGPVCSPEWMHKFIFPCYEEFWGILKAAGKEVVFIVDGNIDVFADDVMACGARGIASEPFTDFRRLARKYENCVLAGEGDCRVLMRNDPAEIRKMVETMVETGKMSGGYYMSVGNHIPFNVPPEAVKCYFDCCAELGFR